MIFEDLDNAVKAVSTAYEFMEWTWKDEKGKPYRPREDDIQSMYQALQDALLNDEGKHDFIKAHGLMVDLTDSGTMVYRMEPNREQAYRMAFAKNEGAYFEWPGDSTMEDFDDDFLM
jgi:hypothetical protein